MSDYLNEKKHTTGTFHRWVSELAPDPDMNQTTPPGSKGDYSQHEVLEVFAARADANAGVQALVGPIGKGDFALAGASLISVAGVSVVVA